MAKADSQAFIRRLRFPPDIERAFQENYYYRNRTTVRFGIFFLTGLSILSALFHLISDGPFALKIAPLLGFLITDGPLALKVSSTFGFVTVIAINLLLVVLAFHREFDKFWQPYMVATTLVSLSFHLTSTNYTGVLFFSVYLLLVICRVQRLQLRWMALQLLGILTIGVGAVITYSAQISSPNEVAAIILSQLILVSVPLLFTVRGERFERRDFYTKYLLAEQANAERQRREQTEKMLHILSQAMGSIVHDLGNPLTAVQGGAETLLDIVDEGYLDKEIIQKFAEIITDGAQMLNYLRLSLMEQTRVLEGKPVPVEIAPASMCSIIEAGIHYQKPRFTAGRQITVLGDDMEVRVDEMRFITIFMNLIGNALKYSDGEVKIVWRSLVDHLIVAVLDEGKKGKGISQAQADKLFVAFGRLDIHSQVEGTGLGLLSVRKIAEAHKGEVFIEGYTNGTTASLPFSTAQGHYPSMLEEGFLTAFVIACPWDTPRHPEKSPAHKPTRRPSPRT